MSRIEKYIPTFKTTDKGWILFHKELRKIFSKKEANTYWIKAWENTGGDSNYNANTKELRTYMSGKGIDIEAPTTWQAITDYSSDLYSSIKLMFWIILIIIVAIYSIKLFVFNNKTIVNTK
jgi:hypothetical protein